MLSTIRFDTCTSTTSSTIILRLILYDMRHEVTSITSSKVVLITTAAGWPTYYAVDYQLQQVRKLFIWSSSVSYFLLWSIIRKLHTMVNVLRLVCFMLFFFLCCFLAVLLSLQLCFASYYLFTVLGFVSWRLHSLCYSALACGMFWLQSMFLFFVLHRHHLVLQLKFSLNKSSLNKSSLNKSLLCR